MTYTIYHNPKCSKSRATLEILNSKGGETTIVEYLKYPPSKEELEEIIQKLNIQLFLQDFEYQSLLIVFVL